MKIAFLRALHVTIAILVACAIASTSLPAPAVDAAATFDMPAAGRLDQESPAISAQYAAILEASTGEVLWERNGRQRVPMASTTKIMTAILAIERGNLTDRVISTVDGPAFAIATDSSILGLGPNDWLSLEDMLYALMLVSGNDAAIAIARHIAGTEEQFVALMNQKAAELGLRDTHFDNSHGLDSPTHYSTAVDMAVLGRYAMQNPTFARIVGTKEKIVSGSRTWELYQQNQIVRTYPGGDGIKTGYTEGAGQALVASATRDGRRIIVSFMRSTQRNLDATLLLDYGFSTRAPAQVGPTPTPQTTPAPTAAPTTSPTTSPTPIASPVAAAPSGNAAEWPITNGYFFTQTNGRAPGTSNLGFAVVDDAAAKFYTEFVRYGGVDGLGYPISHRFMWDGFLAQAFQRGVMQWRPEVGEAYLVNVFDRLHELGLDQWLLEKYQTPAPVDWASDTNKSWDEIYQAHMALIEPYPAFIERFNATPGIPYVAHGLPMAPVADMGNVLVLRLQRSAFQYWKVDTPWAKAGEVTVALGGEIAKAAGLLPAAALEAADPAQAVSRPIVTATPVPTAAPAVSPTPGATPATVTPRPSNGTTVDVALDPAHSIMDIGSSIDGVAEYAVNLRVAKAAQQRLEAAGYTVRLTRSDDRPVSEFNDPDINNRARKEQEARVAAGLPARVFVSIRANGYVDPQVAGTEVYYSAEHGGDDGRRLANAILTSTMAAVQSAGGQAVNRGVKEDAQSGRPFGGFFSLPGKLPMAVVATLFITNPADRAFLARADGPEILGRAIADGIIAYLEGRS